MNDAQTAPEFDLEGDFFDQWIAGASPARRAVTIYGKPALYADFQEVDRELTIERSAVKQGGGDEMGGSRVNQLEARLTEIYDEWVASRTTWIVTVQQGDAVDAAKSAVHDELGLEEPKRPTEPARPVAPIKPVLAKNANDAQKRSHTVRMQTFEQQSAEHAAAMLEWEAEYKAFIEGPMAEWESAYEPYADQVNYRLISAAVVSIKDAAGEVRQTSITVAQLERMADRLGRDQLLAIMAGIQGATLEDSEIPAPFLSGSSEDDLTS